MRKQLKQRHEKCPGWARIQIYNNYEFVLVHIHTAFLDRWIIKKQLLA